MLKKKVRPNQGTKSHLAHQVHHPRRDGGDAFFPDPGSGPARVKDDLAEELAEEFIASITTGEEQAGEAHDVALTEEVGGPFVLSTAKKEFAMGTDASNPADANVEAFPTTARGQK